MSRTTPKTYRRKIKKSASWLLCFFLLCLYFAIRAATNEEPVLYWVFILFMLLSLVGWVVKMDNLVDTLFDYFEEQQREEKDKLHS